MMKFGNIKPDLLPVELRKQVLRPVTGGASGCPVRQMWGNLKNKELIYYRRNNKVCIRRYKKPRQPDSSDQLLHRNWFRIAEKHWLKLTDIQRELWAGYANRNNGVFEYEGSYTNNGRYLMKEVQYNRLQLGLAFSYDAPTTRAYRSRLEVFQNPVGEDDTYSFQVMHNVPNPAGMLLQVEISPATKRPTIKPHPNSYRPIKGKSSASYVSLQESGAVYTVTDARFSVKNGESYGMRLRVIDTECISGDVAVQHFIREVGDFVTALPGVPEPAKFSVGRTLLSVSNDKPDKSVQSTDLPPAFNEDDIILQEINRSRGHPG
jgi:hypothetical protein